MQYAPTVAWQTTGTAVPWWPTRHPVPGYLGQGVLAQAREVADEIALIARRKRPPGGSAQVRRQHRPQPGRGAAAALAVQRLTCPAEGDAGNGMTRRAALELEDGEAGPRIAARMQTSGRLHPAGPSVMTAARMTAGRRHMHDTQATAAQ